MEILIEFEKNLKDDWNVQFFDKVYEKYDKGFKLIYNIQGLTDKNSTIFYPCLKIIFWLDSTKKQLTEDAITYLYSLNCDYKTISIDKHINDIFKTILNFINKEKTNKFLIDLIISGTDNFNLELKKIKKNDFIQELKYIPFGNTSCANMLYMFELKTNFDIYKFNIKFTNDILLIIDNKTYIINTDNIYKKIIEILWD